MSINTCIICNEKICNQEDEVNKIKFICVHKNQLHYECLKKWNEHKCPVCMKYTKYDNDNNIKIYLINKINSIDDLNTKYILENSIYPLDENDLIFLKNYHPESFTFCNHPVEMRNIIKKINDYYGGHSGSSFGYTMRWFEKELREIT
jgi:hypothetical protein